MTRLASISLILFLIVLPIAGNCAGLDDASQPSVTVTPQQSTPPPFTDVPEGHWASDSISNLKELGIVNGYTDGSFNGDKYVTRYELALVLSRVVDALKAALAPQPTTTAEVKDESKIAEEAVNSRKFKQEAAGTAYATVTDVAREIALMVTSIVENNVPHWEDVETEEKDPNSNK